MIKMNNLYFTLIIFLISALLYNCKTLVTEESQSVEIPEDVELVKIPAGTYSSGENGVNKYIEYDYMMMKYPVTNSQYINYLIEATSLDLITIDSLGVFGYYPGDSFWPPGIYQFVDFSIKHNRIGFYSPDIYFTFYRYVENRKESYDNHPVTHITWFGANAYAKFYGMRLPNAAEWEKAARANSGNKYPWGNRLSPNYANYKDSGDAYDNDTTPVGYYNGDGNTNNNGSPYGIYDMAGNVWEWTSSWWRNSSGKVIKGGSWDSSLNNTDSGSLLIYDLLTWFEPAVGYLPTNISREIGFRCVKDVVD